MLILTNEADFDAVYSIMEKSFPPDERRTYDEQKALLSKPQYRIYVAKEGPIVTGFLAVWMLSTPFIEHFAVSEEHRNAGLGGALLDEALAMLGSACLEAEPPTETVAQRRIAFYERHGFALNDHPYTQPPITAGRNAVPLMIMTYPSLMSAESFAPLKAEIMKTVYGKSE